MNLLVLTQKLYTSDVSGLAKRLYPFLKELKKRGHYITLISFYENDSEIKNLPERNEYYNKVITVKQNRKISYLRMLKAFITGRPFKLEFCNSKNMKNAVAEELRNNNYDVLYSHYYKMSQYLFPYKNYKCIVDLCDAFYFIYDKQLQQEKNIFKRIFIKSERNRIYEYEKKCINTFDKCLYISDVDRDFMTDNKSVTNTQVIPNGVDTEYFYYQNDLNDNNEIIYVGLMSYIANHDAVMYFIKNIYPKIKEQIPNVTFKIAGANPKKQLLECIKNDSSIRATGFVDDIRKEISTAMISVAPVRIGAGIQNKILETMSMGIPTVTTVFGAEGITGDENILSIAQNDEELIQKSIELLKDKNKREMIRQNARKYCEENFSWRNAGIHLEKVLNSNLRNY